MTAMLPVKGGKTNPHGGVYEFSSCPRVTLSPHNWTTPQGDIRLDDMCHNAVIALLGSAFHMSDGRVPVRQRRCYS